MFFPAQGFATPGDKYWHSIYCIVAGKQLELFSNPDYCFIAVIVANSISLSLTFLIYEMSKEVPNWWA